MNLPQACVRIATGVAELLLAACSILPSPDIKLDAPYVSTPYEVVDEMLLMARIGPGDVLYDLGCGDGRIVVRAAQRYGARGVGIDIDPRRVAEATAAARSAGVADRARFLQQDLFATDFSEATVVTLYLFPELNTRLMPKLLSLKPGTRIVSHDFGIGDWPPERVERVTANGVSHQLLLWTVPPRR